MAIDSPPAVRWGAPKAQPDTIREEERPRNLRYVDTGNPRPMHAGEPWSASLRQGTLSFHILGDVKQQRSMAWTVPLSAGDSSDATYYAIQYRAAYLRLASPPYDVLAVTDVQGRSATLLNSAQVLNDGLWHTLIGQLEKPVNPAELKVFLSTLDHEAELEIRDLAFSRSLAILEPKTSDDAGLAFNEQMIAVDLTSHFNTSCRQIIQESLDREKLVTDGCTSLPAGDHPVAGLPFRFASSEVNVVKSPHSALNQGTRRVLDIDMPRRLYHPESRDDVIRIDVNAQASEIGFVLVGQVPASQGRYALPPAPYLLTNPDLFWVELAYADGSSERAFPYSPADGGHVLRRAWGAYAVQADARRQLQAIIFHNGDEYTDFHLAALTLNTGRPVMIPAETSAPTPTPAGEPTDSPPSIRRDGGRITLSNPYYQVVLDCSDGFSITQMRHRRQQAMAIELDPASGLEMRVGDTVFTGRSFRTTDIKVESNAVHVRLQGRQEIAPLEMRVTVSVDESPQLHFAAQAVNRADQPLAASIRFPYLKHLALGDRSQIRLFFPQYRTVHTAAPGWYQAANDRAFAFQFFDFYNPAMDAGLAMLTRHRGHDRFDYGASISDSRDATAFIEHPAAWNTLAPGAERELAEASLLFHTGDWHQAMDAYRAWLGEWHHTTAAGWADWWQQASIIRTHLPSRAYDWVIPYLSSDGAYRFDDLMPLDAAFLGRAPDVVHFNGWCDLNHLRHGDYLGGDYAVEDYTGGPEALRGAIEGLRGGHNVRGSLYLIPDRCSKQSRVGQSIGERCAAVSPGGGVQQDEVNWYICLATREWQDHFVQAVARTQRETGTDAIYIDVFGYDKGYTCHSPDHGHEVPMNWKQACAELTARLREALPDDVALWHEFPLPDTANQNDNGHIHYYFLPLHHLMAPSFSLKTAADIQFPPAVNLYRFVFPGHKQVVFPVGMEGTPDRHWLKWMFFNGDSLYDCGWMLYPARDLQWLRRALDLRKRYGDCFSSSDAQPLVATCAPMVYANRFPGEGRELWTLFNGGYRTHEGDVLRVPYEPGDQWFDAWSGETVSPRIEGDTAVVSIRLDPQGLGCVVRERSKGSAAAAPR